MSQKPTTDTTPSTVVSLPESKETEVVEKQSFVQRRIVTPIKNHPKIAIAVGGGLALVGVAAFAGRSSADSPSEAPELSPEETQEVEALVAEAEDTTVA